MFPIIPWLAGAAILGGGGVLWWYSQLTAEEQAEADRIAAEYASDLFDKTLDQLTAYEAKRVHALVRQHFN